MTVYVDVCCVNVKKLSLFTHCFEVLSAVGCDGQICGTVQKKGEKKIEILRDTPMSSTLQTQVLPYMTSAAGESWLALHQTGP